MVTPIGQEPTVAPSPWIVRWVGIVPTAGSVLDVAAGSGRHTRFFLARGHPVTAIDTDVTGLADLSGRPDATILQADLEDGSPWPLPGHTFAAVVVTNYLWRPLLPQLVACVAPGGAFIYETFAAGNERFGKPSNPDFLLKPGELLEAVRQQLEVRGYEQGEAAEPRRAMRQRIAAVRL
jgi:SAM-dependent methyltransferase